MKIWVDADACPVTIKEVLFKAAIRTKTQMVLVANHNLRIPKSTYISTILVKHGADVADKKIAESLEIGDLVITADIPLAADVIKQGAHALNPRGELYTDDDINSRLSMRDFMDDLRSLGIETGGPRPLSKSNVHNFANSLDRFLRRNKS